MKETRLKLLQYITGIGLFLFAGWHLIFSHMIGKEVTGWESVTERATNSGWFVFYILLLIFGIYHGLHGLRTIILEFSIPNSAVRALDVAILLVGIAVFAYAVSIPIYGFVSS